MEKSFIKDMLRESLFSKIKEANKEGGEEDTEKEGGDGQYQELNQDEKKKVQTLTKKIKNATQGAGKLLKLSQVMDAAGVGDADNATDRSAIGKAVSGKPDADGKVRHLTVKQANSMGKVVDNPVAFK
jgi:Skp family chaperone for outer membrane proteins